MTVEQRATIQPSDVRGIEYHCSHCDAVYVIPIDRFDRSISSCPNCREELISGQYKDSSKPTDQGALFDFVMKLKEIRDRSLKVRLVVSLDREADKTD